MHWGGTRVEALTVTGAMIGISSADSGRLSQHLGRNQGICCDNATRDDFFNVSDHRRGPPIVLLLGAWSITTRGCGHPDGWGVHGS